MESVIQYFKSDPEALVWLLLVVSILVISFVTKKKTGASGSSANDFDRLGNIMGTQNSNGPSSHPAQASAPAPQTAPPQQAPAPARVENPLDRLAAFGGAPVQPAPAPASAPAAAPAPAPSPAQEAPSAAPAPEPQVQQPAPAAADSAPAGSAADGSGVLTQYKAGNGQGISEVAAMLEQDPNNLELLDWLAFMYYSNNMLDDALATYNKALTLDPGNVNQLYYLGSTYFKMGDKDKAVECWCKVIELKPDSKIASKAKTKIEKSSQ